MTMWKWLAVAALIYGLMMAAAIISPRSMLATGALDLAALSRAWRESGSALQLHDFERASPPPFTLPEAPAEVLERPDGNHILRWRPLPDAPLSFLGLPVSVVDPAPLAVTVHLRAEGTELLIIGVRERDGSVYSAPLPAAPEWQLHVRPLKQLELAQKTADENSQLDLDQITAVFIAVKPLAGNQQRRNRRQSGADTPPSPLVELDDLGITPPSPEGLGPPLPNQRQPGFGPPEGRRQNRRPENQPPAQRGQGQPPGG